MSSTATLASTVHKITDASGSRLPHTLAAAFLSDPVMSWCYPDDERRGVILTDVFRVLLDATVPHGGVDSVGDDIAGAIWIRPEAEVDEERLAADLGRVSADYAERAFTLLELMDVHHPVQPHEYLFVLGTRPAWQSRGFGSALLGTALTGCDERGMPAYLEATSERNRQLYERHGFEVTEVVTLPDGPPLWCMWRVAGGAART